MTEILFGKGKPYEKIIVITCPIHEDTPLDENDLCPKCMPECEIDRRGQDLIE